MDTKYLTKSHPSKQRKALPYTTMAPSPPVLLNQPPAPYGGGEPSDDLGLDYISRMLMEEDIVDKFLYQYPDPTALLKTQQPFTQILSAPGKTSSDAQETSAPSMLPWQGSRAHIQNPAFFFRRIDTVIEPSTGMDMLSRMAFFRGTEEANKLLPTDKAAVDGSRLRNRSRGDGGTEANIGSGSSSNKMAVPRQSEPEDGAVAGKMWEQLMLNGGDDMCPDEQVLVAVEQRSEVEKQSISRKAPRGRRRVRRQALVADLETLLIRCAEAVATNDQRGAYELLGRIKRHSSPTGDATQRLAHYFADGLEARLAGRGSQLYRSLMEKRTSAVDLLMTYKLFMSVCCFLKVSFLFTNKTIYNAATGRKKLHIVHYGVNDGVQWSDLLRWLANREGGPPAVRITSIAYLRPGFRYTEQTEDTGHQLSHTASKLGVPFEFRTIAARSEDVRAEDLHIHPDEMLVVNNLLCFRFLMDESVVIDRLNPRDMVLQTIREMKPTVFVHAIVNASYSTAIFVTRFRQVLYNFAAHFDVMETTVPRDNAMRLLLEREIIARCAMNIIACEGTDRVERPQNYREWQARNQRAGLRQLPLDPDVVQMLKNKVRKQYHKHFVIDEDQQWLLQGWKGRVLYALSTWKADDAASSDVT